MAQAARIAEQSDRIAELERKLGADSSNSSRPPSLDAPWAKKPAPKRSSRTRSGRKAGKQPGPGRCRGAWSMIRMRPSRWLRIGAGGVVSPLMVHPRSRGCTIRSPRCPRRRRR
ncbi:MAG: DUF6444 domain-containing protein [Actinobacteria bacterium]|nr:DUF6444 domain-containing protein [Actinomycetota bacterium]